MKFLTNWTISVDKLPAYSAFKSTYTVHINKGLLETIYDADREYLTSERKALLKNVMDKVHNNILHVNHAQRCKGIGRFYADESISLICLSRHIKHTLFNYMGWADIDMVKGHPTIIYEIAKKTGNESLLPNFKEYLVNPQSIFDTLIEYYKPVNENKEMTYSQKCDCVKNIFNIAIYGGGHNTWLKDCEKEGIELATDIAHNFVNSFIEDCRDVINIIYKNNPDIVKRVRGDLTDEHKIKCRTMSYWCGAVENEILHICYKYLQKEKVLSHLENVLLEYDGLCFKPLVSNEVMLNHLATLNEKIKKETGLNVMMTFKHYKAEYLHNDLIEIFEGKAMEKQCEENELKTAASDNEAALIIFDELKEVFKCYKNRLFYLKENIWIHDKDEIDNFMLDYILTSNIYYPSNKKPIPFCQNVSKAKHVREALYSKIFKDNNDPELYEKFHTSTKGKLSFNDGVLDLKAKTFTLWEDVPKNSIYTPIKINRNYADYFQNPDNDVIDDIKQNIFETLYGEKTDKALHFLARALAGHHEDKRWATYLGNRNSGKGVEYDLLKHAFQDYVSTFELGNMLYCRKTAGTENVDCSKKLYWLIDLEFVRLAVSQEIPDHHAGLKVNSKTLKKVTGGGDTIVARRNYDRKDIHFTIDTTFYIKGNNSLECDNVDCYETCIDFNSVVQFKTEDEIDAMKMEGRDENEMKRYKIADPDIKNKCCEVEWSNAVIYLLMQNYNTNVVSVENTLNIEDNTLLGQLKEKFEFTYNVNDIIMCSRVQEIMCEFDKGKIVLELSNLNVHKKKSTKRDETRGKFCYIGLKEKVTVAHNA
jgi:hypothetical protein